MPPKPDAPRSNRVNFKHRPAHFPMFKEPVSVQFNNAFKNIAGVSPQFDVALRDDEIPFAHDGAVYLPDDDAVYVTSDQYFTSDEDYNEQQVTITKCQRVGSNQWYRETIPADKAPVFPNGGARYPGGILFCQQGDDNGTPSAIVFMSSERPYLTTTVVESFNGRDFNSLKGIVVHSDGSLWFTDTAYGYEQGLRPLPQMPCQVYRYDPDSGDIRAMADSFDMPNGICFGPGEKTLYVTDTGRVRGDGSEDDGRPASIYAFDVLQRCSSPWLVNCRLFAFIEDGVPEGIKCDTRGNVYAGCGDGLSVFSPGGVILGKFTIPTGVSNFCFGKKGEIFLLSDHRFIVLTVDSCVQGL